MKLINRNYLLKFDVETLKEYLYVLYNLDELREFSRPYLEYFVNNNKLNKYLNKNKLNVLENQIEDAIEYLECKC